MEMRISTRRLVKEFTDLVRIDSEGPDCAVLREYLRRSFRKRFGLDSIVQKTSDSANLLVRVPGLPGRKPLLLAAHMDTVGPGRGIRPIVRKERITSAGDTILAADDKSAIAVFLQTLEILKRSSLRTRPLEILFTYGEESGLLGARHFDYTLLKAKEGLCFDSGGDFGGITIAAPWYTRYAITMKGRASHSGIAPEKGINAIKALGLLVTRLPSGRLDSRTTANVGTIQGGRQNNIVPDLATVTGEVRSLDRSRVAKEISRIRKHADSAARTFRASASISLEQEFQGFSFSRNDPFLRRVMGSMVRMNVRPVLERHNGGSDANILNGRGIRTLNLSIGMENVHSTKEYIKTANLVRSLRFLLTFLTDNAKGVLLDD